MKKPIFNMILGGAIVFLLMHQCTGKKAPTEPRTGTMTSTKDSIVYVPIEKIKEVPKWLKITDKDLVKRNELLNNRINEIEKAFDGAVENFLVLDSISKIEKFTEAIKPRAFQWQTEDENLIADIRGIANGEVEHIELNYLIKPEPKEKDKNFTISAGAGLNVIKAGVGFKGFEVDYLRVNNQNFGTVGYRIKF
jgi:hypothetical protein